MGKAYDVVSLGELLIDFTQYGAAEGGNPLFEANPGGAPANVLSMLTKLGRRCAFIGKVGCDAFGEQLGRVLRANGIDTRGLRFDERAHTTLAFVQTLPDGDRDFSFYRDPGADVLLLPEELDTELLNCCRIFHFGSLSLTDDPCRSATVRAVKIAREAGALISFDPNLREPLWTELSLAREQIRWGLAQCDILKIADNELSFITGETDPDAGASLLTEEFPNIRLLNVTLGAAGSRAYYDDLFVAVQGCPLGGVVDATGAGDTFCACVLGFVLEHGLDALTESDLRQMLRFANSAAYLVTTKRGALCSMPEKHMVAELMEKW